MKRNTLNKIVGLFSIVLFLPLTAQAFAFEKESKLPRYGVESAGEVNTPLASPVNNLSVPSSGFYATNRNANVADDSEEASQGQWRPGVRLARHVAEGVIDSASLPCNGRDLLYRGHVDATYATFDNKKLAVKIVDGSDVRDFSEVCIRLPEDSLRSRFGSYAAGDEISRVFVPDDKAWRFLGNPGAIVWRAPQTNYNETSAPVWAGMGAFDPAHEWGQPQNVDLNQVILRLVKVGTPSGATLTPANNQGLEQVNIFTESNGQPNVNMISTNLGIWEYRAGLGSHTHTNWTFSAPGYWKLYWQAEMNVAGKKMISSVAEQIWAVGADNDLMLKHDSSAPTNRILRDVEAQREAAGLTAPKENGFDYYGNKKHEEVYRPGDSLDTLKEPIKPELPKALALKDEKALKNIYDDEWAEADQRPGLRGKKYEILAFNDGPLKSEDSDDNSNTRLRILTENVDGAEKAKIMAPLIGNEDNDWWPTEPVTPNSYRAGERYKSIPVPDSLLTVYGSQTFSNVGAIASEIRHNQVFAFDQRNQNAPKFTINVPQDKEGLIRNAEVYLSDANNDISEDVSSRAFLGEFTTDKNTGKDVFKILASDMDDDRRAFTVNAGEKKEVSLLFTKPGIKDLIIFVRLNYKDGVADRHPGPIEGKFKFLVGSKTVNLWQQWDQKKGVEPTGPMEKIVDYPNPSVGFYAQYNSDLALYKQTKEKLEKAKKEAEIKQKQRADRIPVLESEIGSLSHEISLLNGELRKHMGAGGVNVAGASESSAKGAVKSVPGSGSLLKQWNATNIAPKVAVDKDGKAEDKTVEPQTQPQLSSGQVLGSPEQNPGAGSAQVLAHSWQYPVIWLLIGAGVMAALFGIGIFIYALMLKK